jgi:signal transduction histidine kinase
MLTEIAKVVADGVGAGSASVWVRSNGHLVPRAYWPAEGARPNQDELDRLVDVSHLGETLGAIGVVKRRGEPLTSVEEGLLQDLAAQAGPVIHNVTLNQQLSRRLAELSDHERELRRSRQNIVAAQDAERRRLERNIHDGAQQHLVALTVKLRLATNFATKDSERTARLLEELDTEAEEADETLAALSRGIYPPALTEHGLEAALRQEANTLELNCRVVTRDLHRHDLDVEGAVYFCCLEALQNAAKHARGAEVEVSLEESVGELQFSVRDRGPGFNEENVRAGSGLKNMRDRIESLGGYVQVFSRPGQGAWIVGRVPVPAEVAV